jgi:hypothetical protein
LVFDRIDTILYRHLKDYTIETTNRSKSIKGFMRHGITNLTLLDRASGGALRKTTKSEPSEWGTGYINKFTALSIEVATKVKGNEKMPYTHTDITAVMQTFENAKTAHDTNALCLRLTTLADEELTKAEKAKSKNDLKSWTKTLVGIRHILSIPDTLHSRPKTEQTCEKMAWGQLPGDEAETGLAKIYPNKKAPSDHPPYMVHFTMTLNADIAERIKQEAKEAAEYKATCENRIHSGSECYDEDDQTLDCNCRYW